MFRQQGYHPEDHVRDYLISKHDPDLNKSNGSLLEQPVMLRDRCRRELLLNDHLLRKKRKYYTKMREEMNKKWEEIEKEGVSLRGNFLSFNEFLIANKAKRERAAEHVLDHQKFKKKTERAVNELAGKLAFLKQIKIELDEKIQQHRCYQEYLCKVLEKCSKEESFKNETDLVERFEYYVTLSQELAQQSQDIFYNLHNAKNYMSKFTERSEATLISLHTHAASLQNRYEEVSRNVRNLEYCVFKIKENMFQRADEINLVKLSISNLYAMVSRRAKLNIKVKKGDIETQLIYIKEVLRHIESVCKMVTPTKKKLEKVNNLK